MHSRLEFKEKKHQENKHLSKDQKNINIRLMEITKITLD